MFRRPHNPHGAKISSWVPSAVMSLLLLSLAAGSACDDAVLGQALPGLPGLANDVDLLNDTEETGGSAKSDTQDLGDVVLEQSEGTSTDEPPAEEASGPAGLLPDPHPCIEVAFQMSADCNEETRHIAAEGVEIIRVLFGEGHVEEALAAAHQWIEKINGHTAACLGGLQMHCHECVEQLLQQGEPIELIEAVMHGCREAAHQVFFVRREAIGAIEDAVQQGDAHHCTTLVRRIAGERAEQNHQVATECVARIEELLAAGQPAEAFEAARLCIGEIRHSSVGVAREIQGISQDCLHRLIRRCADERLIHNVQEATAASLHRVFSSAREAARRIHDALPPSPFQSANDVLPDG